MHADLSAALFMISSACARDRSSAKHLGGHVAGHVHLGGLEAQQAVAGADHADQLRGDVGGRRQIGRDSRRCFAVLLDLGGPAGEGDDDQIAQLRRRAQVPLLAVVVGNETERSTAAQDRRDTHVAADQHSDDRMAGFVDGDAAALVGLIADILGETDLGDQLGFDEILEVECLAPVAQRDDQRLVEQPLDAHRRVARGAIGDRRRR